jgi:UDP-2,3-diacylglucosamine hydrolase
MIIHESPYTTTFDGRRFHLAHGEGLGSDDIGYKILLGIFHNKPLRILYSSMHPLIGMSIGHKWSMNSRLGKGIKLDFLGEEKEDLIRYSKAVLDNDSNIDYFIFGHRHLAYEYNLKEGAKIIFLGDWVMDGSYAVWDGNELILTHYLSI